MRFVLEKAGNRRQFLRTAARGGLLALLAVVASWASRSPRLDGQRCVGRGICPSCGAFPNCGLPAALSLKARQTGG